MYRLFLNMHNIYSFQRETHFVLVTFLMLAFIFQRTQNIFKLFFKRFQKYNSQCVYTLEARQF